MYSIYKHDKNLSEKKVEAFLISFFSSALNSSVVSIIYLNVIAYTNVHTYGIQQSYTHNRTNTHTQ